MQCVVEKYGLLKRWSLQEPCVKEYYDGQFTDNKEVAIIPDNWLDGTSCAVWPTHIRMSSKLNAAVKQKCPPGESWPAFPIKELYRNESYSSARSKLHKAEIESDIGTTAYSSDSDQSEECRRSKRRRRPKIYSSEEAEEIDLVLPPQAPKALSPPSGGTFTSKGPSPGPSATGSSASGFTSRGGTSARSPSSIRMGAPLTLPTTPKARTSESGTSIARDIRMFTILEKLGQRQDQMQEKLNKVLSIVQCLASGSVSDQSGLPDGVALPVSTVEEMDELDRQLEDETVFKALVNHLSVVGGINRSNTCRRVMKECLVHEMAIAYNWYGHKGKRPFGKLRLSVAVQKAVMRSSRCTAAEVELDCREWFRTATDREGGRKKRGEKRKC